MNKHCRYCVPTIVLSRTKTRNPETNLKKNKDYLFWPRFVKISTAGCVLNVTGVGPSYFDGSYHTLKRELLNAGKFSNAQLRNSCDCVNFGAPNNHATEQAWSICTTFQVKKTRRGKGAMPVTIATLAEGRLERRKPPIMATDLVGEASPTFLALGWHLQQRAYCLGLACCTPSAWSHCQPAMTSMSWSHTNAGWTRHKSHQGTDNDRNFDSSCRNYIDHALFPIVLQPLAIYFLKFYDLYLLYIKVTNNVLLKGYSSWFLIVTDSPHSKHR